MLAISIAFAIRRSLVVCHDAQSSRVSETAGYAININDFNEANEFFILIRADEFTSLQIRLDSPLTVSKSFPNARTSSPGGRGFRYKSLGFLYELIVEWDDPYYTPRLAARLTFLLDS